MMRTASIPDNISDVLVKIIYFTHLRRRVLHENLHKAGDPGFTPCDMPVREFAETINLALAEHLQNGRLLFHDSPTMRFGPNNTMQIEPVVDAQACALLRTNRDEYTELQIGKLMENCWNRRVAKELLRQKSGASNGEMDWAIGEALAGDNPLTSLPPNRGTAK